MKIAIVIGVFVLVTVYEVTGQNGDNNPASVNVEQAAEAVTIAAQPAADPVIERSSHSHHHVEPTSHGFWKKKLTWRPRWVKTWQPKRVYVAVWKRVWGPSVLKEWVPIPKPPPGWVKQGARGHGAVFVNKHPY